MMPDHMLCKLLPVKRQEPLGIVQCASKILLANLLRVIGMVPRPIVQELHAHYIAGAQSVIE